MRLILGGPGCGKTTRLLSIVEAELEGGVDPDEIAFVAFTKAAAEESKRRAAEAFALDPETDLPWFRTIHSLAYRRLSMTREEIMDKPDWRDFAEWIGEPITGTYNPDDGNSSGSRHGDKLLRVVDYSATTMMTLEEAYHEVGEDLDWHAVKRFDAAFRRFKTHVAKLDFTDMLLSYVNEGSPLPVRVAVIDEAQDLTAAQWAAVRVAFREAERVYIGGDDDQAIYRWAGADVDAFLGLSEAPEVLDVSHRLPRSIYHVGQRVASRISKRYDKPYRPDDREGLVEWHQHFEDVDLRGEGTWLLLARNGYMLDDLKAQAEGQGVPYTTRDGPAVVPAEVEALRIWEALRGSHEETISAPEARTLARALGRPRPSLRELRRYSGEDLDLPLGLSWYRAMEGIPIQRRDFYVRALRYGESLTRPPRVRIETIHGVKGAEADKVMVILDMSWRTAKSFEADPDHEHRVFYVAVTRAREELHLIAPLTMTSYPL